MKLDYKKMILIGFGFFATSIAWSLYNSYVPVILEGFIKSTTLIGAIMTIDNVFGIVFQPLFGSMSDKTHTKYGKRMPYIIIGIPICAVLFSIVPFMSTLFWLMFVLILFNLVMSFWRAPVVALMPDVTPAPLRSKGNGVINFMGGIGTAIAFGAGGILYNIGGFSLSFMMGGIVMILALIMLLLFVREPSSLKPSLPIEEEKKEERRKMNPSEKKSLLLILCAIFAWFCAYNAVETFFTLFATNVLGVSAGDATVLLLFFTATFIIVAIPAGFAGSTFGRKKCITLGLAGLVLLFIPLLFVRDLMLIRVLLFLGGACWAFININSLPMVVELAGNNLIGTFTGYYYIASFSASIFSPIAFGALRDLTDNYSLLFIYAAIFFALALLCMVFVKHGEAQGSQDSNKAAA